MDQFIATVLEAGPADLELRMRAREGRVDTVVVLVRGAAAQGERALLSHESRITRAAELLPGAWEYVGHDVSSLGEAPGEPLECSFYFAREKPPCPSPT